MLLREKQSTQNNFLDIYVCFFYYRQVLQRGDPVRLKKREFSAVGKSLSLIGSFGLTMGAAILLGYYVGSYIDSKIGTAPWCMLVFLILFMIGAFVKFVREAGGLSSTTKPKGDTSDSKTNS